jgi:hypothetical protein
MFVGPFEFDEGGRSYRCSVERARTPGAGAWWWFGVSGDTQRYAPFHSEPGDTKTSVRAKIVAYYDNLLVRRAAPPEPRHFPGRRPDQAAVAVTNPATTDAAGAPGEPTPVEARSDELETSSD